MLRTRNLWQAPVVIVIARSCSKSVFRTIACHHRRRLFQGAAIFVVLDVGVSPSFGSRCRLPAMALPTHRAHLSGAFTSYLHLQARRRNRGSEQHGKGNHKNGNWCKASYVARRDALHGSAVRYQKPNNHLHLQKHPNRVRNLFEVRVPFWLLTVINCAATMPVAPPEPFLRQLATPSFWQELNSKNVNKKS